jgi:hypothetical protein
LWGDAGRVGPCAANLTDSLCALLGAERSLLDGIVNLKSSDLRSFGREQERHGHNNLACNEIELPGIDPNAAEAAIHLHGIYATRHGH